MGNAESRDSATGSFQHSLNDDALTPLRPKNASARYQQRQHLRSSSARNSTRGIRSNSNGHVLGTPPYDESKLNGCFSVGNEFFPGHERSKKALKRPMESRFESPKTKLRRLERGLESGTAHYFTGSQAMISPISPPPKRSVVGTKTSNDRATSNTIEQSSLSQGSQSDPPPRVPQYDQKTILASPPSRSPSTHFRSMRSASTRSACKISGLLGTTVEASDSSAGEGIVHASFEVNGSGVDMTSKATDSDETTVSSFALSARSSKFSSREMKKCNSCRKPQNTDEHPLWKPCFYCGHKNHPSYCKPEGAGKQIVQDEGSASQRKNTCSRCTAKTMESSLVNDDGYSSPHSQEHPPKRRKTEADAVRDLIDGQNSPSQTVQASCGNNPYISGTGTPLTAVGSEKPVQIGSETADISNRDALLEVIGKPSFVGVHLAGSRKSSLEAPGAAQTSIEGEQQDLNVHTFPIQDACSRTTKSSIREVSQESSEAHSPQAPRIMNNLDRDKGTRRLRSSARSPTNTSAGSEEVKNQGSGNGSRDTGEVLPSPDTLSKDNVVCFPLCTSCRTKRVFNVPRNGEKDILCKTCASVKRSFDATTRSQNNHLEDSGDFQIPETPAVNRNGQQRVFPELERQSEMIEGASTLVNGLRNVDNSERWPFGPKLKSAEIMHTSDGNPVLNQVQETPVGSRPNGAARPEVSVNKDLDACPPETALIAQAPSSSPTTVPAALDLSLQDDVESEPGREHGLSEVGEAETKTTSELERLKKDITVVYEDHDKSLSSLARSLTDEHEKAIQAKEQELQQVKAELVQLKAESAKAALSEAHSLSMAKDEIRSLRSQLAVHDQVQGDRSKELTRLRIEVQALRERPHSSENSPTVVPKFIHTNLFDAAPELLAENVFFDAEAKKEEIEKRPSKKQTFGRRLALIRRERGQYPHREVYRHSPKPREIYRDADICLVEEPTGSVPVKRRALQDLGPGEVLEDDVPGSKGEEEGPTPLEEMMGLPRNAIPCLVEGQLAYRECKRDAKGRLPRAKATYKVGRNVAGQLK